mgnify:CR=1 FL=1|jgi:F-type H+-transporting ATPase subunit b
MFDESFWVAMAFFAFVGIMIYKKVPNIVAKFLDKRADDIRRELDDARALREEAQALLASYQRKQRDAEAEAPEIVEHANQEARRLTEAAEAQVAETLERRTQLAVDKIAQAEAQAVQEVRNISVDVAVAATTRVIGDQMNEELANDLIDKSVTELRGKLPQA